MSKAEKIYQYETKKIAGYREKLSNMLRELEIPTDKAEELTLLFEWNGNARAIKSKQYQEMKLTRQGNL
mgnify:CR=1 FL=1